jgi:hypothetical protein
MAKNVIINGVTYNDVPEVNIPISGGGTAEFFDTSDADAAQGDVLAGKTYYKDGKKTGSMPNNGETGGTISTKAGTVTIPAGYTSGGSASISATEQAKIIAKNIKAGITLLGQVGDSYVIDTELASGAAGAPQIVNGYSAFVNGARVNGTATLPVISQDATTKVLSIS